MGKLWHGGWRLGLAFQGTCDGQKLGLASISRVMGIGWGWLSKLCDGQKLGLASVSRVMGRGWGWLSKLCDGQRLEFTSPRLCGVLPTPHQVPPGAERGEDQRRGDVEPLCPGHEVRDGR